MKKSILLLLFVLMLFSFSSCGEKKTAQTEPNTSSAVILTSESVLTSESSTSESTTAESTTAKSTTAETTIAESTTKTTTAKTTAAEKTTAKKTKPKTHTTEPASSEKTSHICFVTIDCKNIKSNLSSLKKGKEAFVVQSGYILKETAVPFEEGESAFDALKRACRENTCTDNCKYCQKGGIQLEFSFTPAYKSYYVEGIHQLYEKDCGSLSGWLYSVNGKYCDTSSSEYKLKDGDKITFAYTVSMGDDLTFSY